MLAGSGKEIQTTTSDDAQEKQEFSSVAPNWFRLLVDG